jgi:hypothetical protein
MIMIVNFLPMSDRDTVIFWTLGHFRFLNSLLLVYNIFILGGTPDSLAANPRDRQ